jgi:tetrahydromethanopterin S-methyltransferase subunit G
VFVLAYLTTLLAPANASTAFAGGPAQANSCGGVAVQAANVPAITIQSADAPVNVPAEAVNAAIFEANWRDKYPDAKLIEGIVYNQFLWNSTRTPSYETMSRFRTRYEESLRDVDRKPIAGGGEASLVIQHMLSVASFMPELVPALPEVWKDLHARFHYSLDDDDSRLHRDIGYAMKASHETVMEAVSEELKKAHACAKTNPAVAETYDRFHGDRLKASIRDNAKTIIAKNPSLPVLKEINDRIGPDGSITVSLNELTALTKAEFGKINATLDDIQKTVKDIDERQKVIVDYLSNQAEKQAVQELAKKKAEEFQLKISAAQSGLSILTTLTAQISPERAKQVSVTGNAVLQTVVTVNGWLKATAGRDLQSSIFSLSSVVLTGNVLSAAMSVVSLFGPQEPTPEQMILEEIGKLRQQVNELRVEMHERFDRIDQNLNNIYTSMMQRFDQIDVQLGKVNGNVLEVQQSLAELDLKLSRIERNNFELLNALGRRPLLDAVNGGLSYQERTGQPMPYQPEFVSFENALHGWGAIHAFDAVNAGPTQRDYSDAATLAELNAYPIDANINYINGWLQARGLPAISTKRLPSPRDWLFASRAYMRLAMEWPQHMQRIDPKRGEALNQIGLELEAAMRNLSTSATATGAAGNELLFTSVISHYQGKVDALDAAIGPVEDAFMNEVRVNRLGRAEPFDVHGYIYQKLSFRSPEARAGTCNSQGQFKFEMPSGFEERIPNYDPYNLAEYLGLGKFLGCVYDEWSNIVQGVGDHKVVLYVRFNGTLLMTQSLTSTRKQIPPGNNWIRDNWPSFRAQFGAYKVLDPMTPEQEAARQSRFNDTLNAVETALRNYQHELYGRVMSEMNQGSLKPLVNEVAGSKALLDTVVALGLPRAVQNDEFLHAMLYGNQQLVDERLLAQDYARKLAQPIEQTNLTYNPRVMLREVADGRREVFGGLVNDYLGAITAKQHSEEADYIAVTRSALDLTRRVLEIESGTPDNRTQVYLPVVRR